jgi:hypothetical protein
MYLHIFTVSFLAKKNTKGKGEKANEEKDIQ